MDVFPKYIIEDGCLIISRVTFHKDMVIEKDLVRGGGMYVFSHEVYTLYGESVDFGRATLEDVQQAVTNHKVFSHQYDEDDMSVKYKFLYEDEDGKIIELN